MFPVHLHLTESIILSQKTQDILYNEVMTGQAKKPLKR